MTAAKDLGEVIAALDRMDKSIAKRLKSELFDLSMEVVRETRSLLPSRTISRWGKWIAAKDGRDFSLDLGAVSSAYKVETQYSRARGQNVRFGYRAVQPSAVGMILESIGAPGGTGSQFVSSVVNRIGKRPNVKGGKRFLVPAYYAVMPRIEPQMEALVEKAKREAGL